jgi:S1-C subfamily serine protease
MSNLLILLSPLIYLPLLVYWYRNNEQKIDHIAANKDRIFRILIQYKIVSWYKSEEFDEFGNGILIAPDIILTNYHVVSEYISNANNKVNKEIIVSNNTCSLHRNDIEIIVADKVRDLCIIRIKKPDKLGNIIPFKLVDVKADVGDDVIAIQTTDEDLEEEYLITFGKCGTYFDTDDDVSYLNTNLHIPPGFSGTPLLNTKGKVIGLNTESYDPAQVISGSVAVSEIITFLDNCCIPGYIK